MNDDLTGQRLGTALRDHVPSTPRAPFDLADVKAGASRIRRRRTVTGVAAAAVAAAVLTPAGFMALSGDGTGPAPGPATQAPTAVPSPSLVPEPRDDVTLEEDSPRGDDPLDWAHPSFTGAGPPYDALPEGTDQVARLGERWAGGRDNGEDRTVVLFDTDGAVLQEFEAQSFAVSDNHELVAWTTGKALMLMDDTGRTRELATLPGNYGDPVDLTGGAGCVDESEVEGCRVVVSYGSDNGPDVVTGDGTITPVSEAVVHLSTAHGDVAAGPEMPAAFENTGCTRLIDLGPDGETRWKNCDVYVWSFSPDGRWMTVVDRDSDGWGPSRIGVADAATGKIFFWIDPTGDDRGLGNATWEGSDHLVVDSYDFTDREWRLFRVSVTGEVEQAADMVPGADGDFPFIAPVQP